MKIKTQFIIGCLPVLKYQTTTLPRGAFVEFSARQKQFNNSIQADFDIPFISLQKTVTKKIIEIPYHIVFDQKMGQYKMFGTASAKYHSKHERLGKPAVNPRPVNMFDYS